MSGHDFYRQTAGRHGVVTFRVANGNFDPPVSRAVLRAVIGHQWVGFRTPRSDYARGRYLTIQYQFVNHRHGTGGGQIPVGAVAATGNGAIVSVARNQNVAST